MNKLISAASAAVVFTMTAGVAIAPASAAGPMGHSNFQQQDRYISNYCAQNPQAGQCNDWQSNHSNWNNQQYQSFYRSHQHDRGFGSSAIAGLFGVAIGAALSNSGSSNHIAACKSAYHSYSVRTDSFLGYDNMRHTCRL